MTAARDVIERALAESYWDECGLSEQLEISREQYVENMLTEKPAFRNDADAILAALEAAGKKVLDREPTLEMIDAARTAYFGCGGVCNPKPWWCAMWDAAERRKEP